MAQSTKLAPMMQLFALEYIIDFNGKEAAIRAGYKPNYAGQQAHRLLNDERVLSAITDAKKYMALIEPDNKKWKPKPCHPHHAANTAAQT